jgi:sulfide dehydrogenase cytochrome subunit
MKSLLIVAAALGLVCGSASAQDRNLGRNLAAQCANCHGTNGVSQGGVPGLAGQGRAYIIAQMSAFKSGQRSGPASTIMHQLAKGYTDEQIAAMADFFSAQKPGK